MLGRRGSRYIGSMAFKRFGKVSGLRASPVSHSLAMLLENSRPEVLHLITVMLHCM